MKEYISINFDYDNICRWFPGGEPGGGDGGRQGHHLHLQHQDATRLQESR